MSVRNAMRRLVPPGSVVLFLLFLTGIWVTMSPFAMTTQPSGQHWITSTITNVTIGAVLLVVSLLGILAYLALALRDLMHEAQTKQEADQEIASS
jgi:protein-S-isoprenylcysteine O-methyltransferase Ste14